MVKVWNLNTGKGCQQTGRKQIRVGLMIEAEMNSGKGVSGVSFQVMLMADAN